MPHPPFFILDEKSNAPLYRQIYEIIRRSILSGKSLSGSQLPATRHLAEQLGVSRLTVLNAYDQLLAEGYLESRGGSGTFVTAHLPEEFLQTADKPHWDDKINPPPRRIKFTAYGKNLQKHDTKFFYGGGKDLDIPFQQGVGIDKFPFETWRKLGQKWQKKMPLTFLNYQDSRGFALLREAIAAHLVSSRGLRCSAEQVIITNGSQQSLDLIGRVFLEKTSEVFVEDPCYLGASAVFAATGAKLVAVTMDENGFDIQEARKKSKKARLAYVTPSFQYPLGITMTLARRMNLLEWANENESFIIEDDYNSEFRYVNRPLPSLQGLDRNGRVIYLGTFSKTIFPALRLGCLVLPTDLVEVFAAARALNDLHSPIVEQAILAEFIAERHFARHIRRMRAIYKERQTILVAEAKKHLEEWLEIAPSEAGMHLIGWLPEGVNDREVARQAARAKLKITPLSPYYIKENRRGGLILGYTAFNEIQIKKGVRRLAEVLKDFNKK